MSKSRRRRHGQLGSSEDYGIYDGRSSARRDRRKPLAQTMEIVAGRFVEITFDPVTRECSALGFRSSSRLQLIEAIIDDFLKRGTVAEVLGGAPTRKAAPQECTEDSEAVIGET